MNKQYMSIGFADLAHFVKLLEAVGEERTIEYLQEAFKAAGDAIVRHGGQIRKYIGDMILFTFTDPRQAVQAAREIATGYKQKVGAITLRFNVAVATGEVLVCQIGHPSHLIEDVMGTTVNRAALLLREAAQMGSGVALCDETEKYA